METNQSIGLSAYTSKSCESLGSENSPDVVITVDTRVNQIADAVFTVNMGQTPVERKREIHALDGSILIPSEDEALDRGALLAGTKATLWFSSTMSRGGVSRSIELTKKVKKETVADDQRQNKLDTEFMKLKRELGLGKHIGFEKAVVNYSITAHTIEVYDENENVLGRYDLLDKGINEDPNHRINGGGGIKQLLRDRGLPHDDQAVEKVFKELNQINHKMKKIIEPETGKTEGIVFVAESMGNMEGAHPFIARTSNEAIAVLQDDHSYGFYIKTMEKFGLITVDKGTFFQPDKLKLTKEGAGAFNDIGRALALRNTAMNKLNEKINEKKGELKQASTTEEKQKLDKEIQELTAAYNEIGGANKTLLNFTMMELNREIKYKEPGLNSKEEFVCDDQTGQVAMIQKTATGKELLQPITKDEYRLHGIKRDDTRGADRLRNDHIDRVAKHGSKDFVQVVKERNYRRSWFFFDKHDSREKKQDKEILQIGTNVGALIHQVGARPSSDPSRIRHNQYIEGREESQFAQESKGLVFLISGVINDDMKGFGAESKLVQDILQKSLSDPQSIPAPAYNVGDDVDQATTQLISQGKVP